MSAFVLENKVTNLKFKQSYLLLRMAHWEEIDSALKAF